MHSSEEALTKLRFEQNLPKSSEAPTEIRRNLSYVLPIILIDLLTHLPLPLYFRFDATLDNTQSSYIALTNYAAGLAGVIIILLFLCGLYLRYRFIKRNPNPGVGLILSAPTFILSLLPFLLSFILALSPLLYILDK